VVLAATTIFLIVLGMAAARGRRGRAAEAMPA